MRIRSAGLRSLACLPLLASALLPLGAAQAATTVHDVTAYGAVKDDQIDDTAAFQAAMDAAQAGETVYVPSGAYVINGTVLPQQGTTLAGDPAGLSILEGSGTIGDSDVARFFDSFVMQDLMVKDVAITMLGWDARKNHLTYRRLVLIDTRMRFQAWNVVVSDSIFLSSKATPKTAPVDLYAVHGMLFRNNLEGLNLSDLDWVPVYWPGASQWTDLTKRLKQLQNELRLVDRQGAFAAGFYGNDVTDLVYDNNIVNADPTTFVNEGINDHAVYLWGHRNAVVKNSWFRGWPADPGGGVKLRNGAGAVITGNVLHDTGVITYVHDDQYHPPYLTDLTVCDNLYVGTQNHGQWDTGFSYWRLAGYESGLSYFRNTVDDPTKKTTINLTNALTGSYHVYDSNRFADGTVVPVVKDPAHPFAGYETTAPPADLDAQCAQRPRPDIPVPPISVNVARDKPALQKSTGYGGLAQRAVDGTTNGYYGQGSVTHTQQPESEAWWQVDLGSNYQISDIALWNRDRNDCCPERLSKYYVFVSAQPFASESVAGTLAQPGVHAYYSDLAAGRPSGVAVNTTGRYVRVQLTSTTDPLSLAEVQVFSPYRAGGLPGAAGGSSRAARGQ